jgi:hypothetical protein
MFCGVALHEKTPDSVASDEARSFRGWVKRLPGFVGAYHVQDLKTGRMISITLLNSEESVEALRGHTPPDGSDQHLIANLRIPSRWPPSVYTDSSNRCLQARRAISPIARSRVLKVCMSPQSLNTNPSNSPKQS